MKAEMKQRNGVDQYEFLGVPFGVFLLLGKEKAVH
jgi:hypothetical protein